MNTGQAVTFWTGHNYETGIIIRVWKKPEANPYLTVLTDDGRRFICHPAACTLGAARALAAALNSIDAACDLIEETAGGAA